jgi:hypothetical protein
MEYVCSYGHLKNLFLHHDGHSRAGGNPENPCGYGTCNARKLDPRLRGDDVRRIFEMPLKDTTRSNYSTFR